MGMMCEVSSTVGGCAAAGSDSAGTAANVAAPATTLFRKSRRPAVNFLDFAMIASACVAGRRAPLPDFGPLRHNNADQCDYSQTGSRIKRDAVILILVEQNATNCWSENSRKSPRRKNCAIV